MSTIIVILPSVIFGIIRGFRRPSAIWRNKVQEVTKYNSK